MWIPSRLVKVVILASLLAACEKQKSVVIVAEGDAQGEVARSRAETATSRTLSEAVDRFGRTPSAAIEAEVKAALDALDGEIATLAGTLPADNSEARSQAQRTLADLRAIRDIEERRFSKLRATTLESAPTPDPAPHN